MKTTRLLMTAAEMERDPETFSKLPIRQSTQALRWQGAG